MLIAHRLLRILAKTNPFFGQTQSVQEVAVQIRPSDPNLPNVLVCVYKKAQLVDVV